MGAGEVEPGTMVIIKEDGRLLSRQVWCGGGVRAAMVGGRCR